MLASRRTAKTVCHKLSGSCWLQVGAGCSTGVGRAAMDSRCPASVSYNNALIVVVPISNPSKALIAHLPLIKLTIPASTPRARRAYCVLLLQFLHGRFQVAVVNNLPKGAYHTGRVWPLPYVAPDDYA